MEPTPEELKARLDSLESRVSSELSALANKLARHNHNGQGDSDELTDISVYGLSTLRYLTAENKFNIRQSTLSVGAGFTISPATSSYIQLSAGAAVTSDVTTAISDGIIRGQILILEGTSAVNTITIKDAANTVLGADVVLGLSKTLTLIWNGADWLRIANT